MKNKLSKTGVQDGSGIRPKKWWFRLLKTIGKLRYKKTDFYYLGEEISNGGIVLANHEGTHSPLAFEIYGNKPIRFWGAYQMNSGLKELYLYMTKVYFHEKKHWSLFRARFSCLVLSPLTNLFYKGLELISTYPDLRFKSTVRESIDAIKDGYNIVIFPELSNGGYKKRLEGFHAGVLLFAERAYAEGLDLPVFVAYFNKKNRVCLVDAPVRYSQLKATGLSRDRLAGKLCERCNELGEMTYDKNFKELFSKAKDRLENVC